MRPSHTIAAIVFGWIAAIAVVAFLLYEGRQAEFERIHRSADSLSLVLEANTVQAFQAVNLSLTGIADQLSLRRNLSRHDAAFRHMLKGQLQDLPYVRAIFVIGPDGRILHDTDYPKTPDISLADRPYFKLHRENPSLVRDVSRPIISRSDQGWFVATTRRIGTGDPFRGIIVAAVTQAYFEGLYQKMHLGTDDFLTLFHDDGAVLARYPAEAGIIGQSMAGRTKLFTTHLRRAPSGSFQSNTGLANGQTLSAPSVISYRRVEGLPLVVTVTLATQGELAQWRRVAIAASVAMAALTLAIALLLRRYVLQKRIRDQQRERRAQTEKLEAMGQLTSGISHDFANLLNIISNNLNIIRLRQLNSQSSVEEVEIAQRAVGRGSALIKQLMRFARKQPVQVEAVDLNAALLAAQDILSHAVGAGVEIRIEPRHDVPPCLLDEAQLEVALINLVVNASDAMNGAGRITLRIEECDEASPLLPPGQARAHVCLAVTDTGPGMTAEQLKHAAEPFFTTKGDKGTGLGLPQVYRFMHRIGGSARIDSTPGSGTTVYLYFRRAQPDHPSSLLFRPRPRPKVQVPVRRMDDKAEHLSESVLRSRPAPDRPVDRPDM